MFDLAVGARVELHPATAKWMMGDRYGTIVALLKDRPGGHIVAARVELDKSGDETVFAIDLLTILPETTIVDAIVKELCDWASNPDLDLVWVDGCVGIKCDDMLLCEWFIGEA